MGSNWTSIKRISKSIHILSGLWIGFVISLICLTGSLVVYKPTLEKQGIRHLAYVTVPAPGASPLPLDCLYRNVQRTYPKHQVENLVLYGEADEAYNFRTKLQGIKGRRQIYVNQYTGEVLGEDVYASKFLQWMYDLHTNLFMGKTGLLLVGINGLALLLMLVTGLIILPSKVSRVLRATTRSGFVRSYKLHLIVGIIGLIPLSLIAFTGAYWAFPEVYQGAFEKISEGKAVADRPRVEEINTDVTISLDSILISASRYHPRAVATMIFFPKKEGAPYSVRMRSPQDYSRTGSDHVYIHPSTAKVVSSNLWHEKPTAEKLTRAMYFIHFGEFWGHYSRILWVIVGLLVPTLYFTGLYMWWKKRIKGYRKRTS